ncbi:MAG: hypothetical protein K5855_01530 [Oscillospiraceae bacterium]|nr:hypothetical protein [Oscillospiraceae bacterium]
MTTVPNEVNTVKDSIPFIDISETHCWMVYLMPFDSDNRSDYQRVDSFQRQCIERGIFGMGWDVPCLEYGTHISPKNIQTHLKSYREAYNSTISEDALNGYLQIKKNDYVIMRLKNSHYYVGKVSSDSAFFMYREGDPVLGYLSWGCTVERWVEFPTDGDVPSEIVGRFSQRIHPTIQRIAPYRQRFLVIAMYENALPETERKFSIPKLKICEYNFAASLNYMELEDLVAVYIAEKHAKDGYLLLPSSCKISQPDYEFRFVSGGRRPISCQVKNRKPITVENYTEERAYEKIYLFSGMWSNEDVDELRQKYKAYSIIQLIKPSELFATLNSHSIFQNQYYDYQASSLKPKELPLKGYIECKKPNGHREYSIDDVFACFVKGDGLFYSSEFGALVLSWHILGNHEKELEFARTIHKDINKPGCPKNIQRSGLR